MTLERDDDTKAMVGRVAGSVASGIGAAAQNATVTARRLDSGAAEFRKMTRRQPITVAVLMLSVGYVLGRIVAAGRRPTNSRSAKM